MAGFGTSVSRPLYGRGPSAGLRFTLYTILAVVLMYFDQRGGWMDRIQFVLQSAIYPVQVALASPSAAWRWLTEGSHTRSALQRENQVLQARLRELELSTLRLRALESENAQLRRLTGSLPPLVRQWVLAEVIEADSDALRQRLLVNRGSTDGLALNQAAVDASGLLGQVSTVNANSAWIILLTDPQHAIPVQLERNQLLTVAVGTGTADEISLPYLAANADIKEGDVLLSSGLGQVFPAGYPVGVITEISRNEGELTVQVRARTSAQADRAREVLLISFEPEHPASPSPAVAGASGAAVAELSAVQQP